MRSTAARWCSAHLDLAWQAISMLQVIYMREKYTSSNCAFHAYLSADFNSDGMVTQQSPDSWTWEGSQNRKSFLIFAQGYTCIENQDHREPSAQKLGR